MLCVGVRVVSVVCVVWHADKPRVSFQNACVYRHHAHTSDTHVRVVPVHTGTF